MANQIRSEKNRGMFVYIIRWQKGVDSEEESGNFEVCYTNEKDAEKAMLEDMENTKADWQKDENERGIGETIKSRIGEKNENGCHDYCGIWFEQDSFDYYSWWIDKLELVSEV